MAFTTRDVFSSVLMGSLLLWLMVTKNADGFKSTRTGVVILVSRYPANVVEFQTSNSSKVDARLKGRRQQPPPSPKPNPPIRQFLPTPPQRMPPPPPPYNY